MVPNDETEQSRLDLMHHMFCMMLDGALYVSPISRDVQRILDVGTGTGICTLFVYLRFLLFSFGVQTWTEHLNISRIA